MYGYHSAWAALGLYHAGMLAAILALWNRKPAERKVNARLLWLPLAACVFSLGGVAMYFLWPCMSHNGSTIANRLADFGVSRHTWPYLAVYFSVVNSTIEEFFWRGCLMSVTLKPVGNDLLFGGYHSLVLLAFASPIWAVPVFCACAFAGWLWRMLRIATGGLLFPIITHVIADVSIVIAVHLRAFT
ncbi:CPBP family intramembrane metalloprotease [bacterium]|nr:CPBP family intramembrane metalloprotease [bacterium]